MVAVTIPDTVLDAVEQYMEIYQVSKQLEQRMHELRQVIEPFMKDNEIDLIRNRDQTGKVQLTFSERAKTTSRYTTYEIETLSKVLEPALVQKCIVEVVDKDKVEALTKLGEIPPHVSMHKSTSPSYSLTVRIDK